LECHVYDLSNFRIIYLKELFGISRLIDNREEAVISECPNKEFPKVLSKKQSEKAPLAENFRNLRIIIGKE
jgi:hypothetical protein